MNSGSYEPLLNNITWRYKKMMSCGTMKKGEVYKCQDCGFAIEVVNECDCDHEEPCQPNQEACCDFQCCGKPMVRK